MAFIASVRARGAVPPQSSGTADFTGADFVVVQLTWSKNSSFSNEPILSDSGGNTFTPLTSQSDGGPGVSSRLYYNRGGTYGASYSITLSNGGGASGSTTMGALAAGFSGSQASPFDQESGTGNGSVVTSLQPGSITATTAYLLVTGLAEAGTGAISINSSFNLVSDSFVSDAATYYSTAMAWKVSTGSAENPTWSWSANFANQQTAEMASFKFNAGGVSGSAAWTEAQDTWAATGTVLVSGSAAWTEGPDLWAGTGGIFGTGTAAWTEGPDIWAATGTVATGPVGSAAWTEAPDLWAGTGTVLVSGSAAWTEGPDIWSGTGTITLPPVTGVGAWTEAADRWAGLGNNGQVQTGGHFIPLTRKQEQELQKRRRKERKAQEAAWDERRIDADSIAADMRAQLLPSKTIAEVINEVTEADDDDDDLIAVLLNA